MDTACSLVTIFTKRIYYRYGHTLGPELDTAFSVELKKLVIIGVAIRDRCHIHAAENAIRLAK